MLSQEETKKRYREKQFRKSIGGSLLTVISQQGVMLIFATIIGIFLSLIIGIAAKSYGFDYVKNVEDIYKNLTSTKTTFGLLLNIFMYILFLFLPFAAYLLLKKKKVQDVLSFSFPKPLDLFTSIFISLGFFVIGKYLSTFILLLLQTIHLEPKDIPLEFPDGVFNIILFTIMIAVLPPLLEEFAYRGVVLGAVKKQNPLFAVLFSALAFSFMHGTIQQIPYAFTVGIAIAYFVVKYNSIWIGVIIHFIINGFSVILSALENKISMPLLGLISISADFVFIAGAIIFAILFVLNNKLSLPQEENGISFGRALVNMFKSPFLYVFIVITILMVILNGYVG